MIPKYSRQNGKQLRNNTAARLHLVTFPVEPICKTIFGWRPTSLCARSLAASCKVKGLSDCQLRQVLVLLLHIDGSPLRQKLCEGRAVVHDVAVDLKTAVTQLAG